MPSKLTGETHLKLDKIGAKVAFRWKGEVNKYDPVTKEVVIISPRMCVADLIDRATGQVYAQGKHPDSEELAALDAIENAKGKDKPLTPAQMADPRFMKGLAAAKENDALKAELAALKAAQQADSKPTKSRTTTAD